MFGIREKLGLPALTSLLAAILRLLRLSRPVVYSLQCRCVSTVEAHTTLLLGIRPARTGGEAAKSSRRLAESDTKVAELFKMLATLLGAGTAAHSKRCRLWSLTMFACSHNVGTFTRGTS